MNADATRVTVVGAGPVGLSLAIELGLRGVACRVVERNDRVGYSPRAKMTNVRTREHLRRWGIADELRRASPIRPDYPVDVVFATRMNGPLLARFADAWSSGLARNDLYAESAQWVPQYTLEEVLRARAVSIPGVTVSFDTALDGFEQDAAGVSVRLSGRHGPEEVRCEYLVGADGARSLVRKLIGAQLVGDGASLANLNIVFRSHRLAAMHAHGPAVMYWMVNADVPAVLGPMSDDGLWYFIATKIDSAGGADADAAAMIRRSTGLDPDVEVLSADPWVARRLLADRYRRGRVFLAGDACHLHPPFGGFGMNMGVGDSVDLGWKLAAVLQGWGGPGLLDSYEEERRPVHDYAIGEAVANYATTGNQLARPGLEDDDALGAATRQEVGETILMEKTREMRSLGVVKGYHYSSSSLVVPDGSPPPMRAGTVYQPSAHPGCVAPHLWLRDGSSLYDHWGPGFTLLVCGDGHEDGIASFRAAAHRVRVPLAVVAPGDHRLASRYGASLALVRPDGHVAWRGMAAPDNPAAVLDAVRGAVPALVG